MKFVIMAVAAIVLLGAGAGGAYFFLDKPAVAAGGPADEAKKAEHEAKEAEAKEAQAAAELIKPQYVRLDALNLPIIDESGVTQIVSLVVSIEVPAVENVKQVEDLRPRLKDAFIQDMYGALNRKNAMQNGVVQVDTIKERLNRVSARVLGKEMVKDVLLEVVQQRSL